MTYLIGFTIFCVGGTLGLFIGCALGMNRQDDDGEETLGIGA